ncbi:ATPase, T2SS/T4P/T4SS family [Escherichia coli]
MLLRYAVLPAIPQDARIAENFLKPVIFLARYSHYPCVGGVYAVFRRLKMQPGISDFRRTWLHATTNPETIRRMLQRPEGIIVFIRPAGSGKSTTLRTASEAYLRAFGFNHNDNMRLPRNAFSPLNHRRRAAFPASTDGSQGFRRWLG